jgi:hypothetical protein
MHAAPPFVLTAAIFKFRQRAVALAGTLALRNLS